MAKFFVSYSRSDKDEVSKVVALLSAAGHEVWWDNDIPVLDDWWRAILTHIEWCEVFIFVASEKSLQSDYCLAELKYANERQRPILPFILQEDPSTLNFPATLPHRNQWLIYDGDSARMLSGINAAYKNIAWHLHKDLDAPRPSEPKKGGKSLAQLYQAARRFANDQQFEEAKRLFQDIKRIDFEEWGADCDQWLARLINYEQIVDLVKDLSTLNHARQAWQKYVRTYGDEFDPYPIKSVVVKARPSKNRRIAIVLISIGVVVLVSIFALQLLNNANEVRATLTPTETLAVSATEIVAATAFPSVLPTSTIAPSDTSEPTAIPSPTLTPSLTLTPSSTPNFTITNQYLEGLFTQTMDAFLREQNATGNAVLTLVASSWTTTFTSTASASSTLTPSPTIQPTATIRPTQLSTAAANNSRVTVTTDSANIRNGPGTSYLVIGNAGQGASFDIIARTSDSEWFLINFNGTQGWIANLVVNAVSNSVISIALTIPPTPTTPELGNVEVTSAPNSPRADYHLGQRLVANPSATIRAEPSVYGSYVFGFQSNPQPNVFGYITYVYAYVTGEPVWGRLCRSTCEQDYSWWWPVRIESTNGYTGNGWVWQYAVTPG